MYKLVINYCLASLNEYIDINRKNTYLGNKLKRDCDDLVCISALQQLKGVNIKKPVILHYTWYEKNKRRDKDNIAFAQKFVQDGLVKAGVLQGDGWKHIKGFTHDFKIDKLNPRIEVEMEIENA